MPRRQTRTGGPKKEDKAPASLRGVRPWGEFAKKYFDAGWCPLPLPPRKKSSPPTGTTGKYEMPTKARIAAWHKSKDARGNIAIRVPEDVIGIDVDAYDGKDGKRGLATLEEQLGPLPETWTLTSRTDGTSGIRFFRVPGGLHWPGEPVPDVQIVQNHHRYAVAYPSVHPDTGETYLWYRPGDALTGHPSVTIDEEIPQITALVKMPQEWVEGLTGGKVWRGLAADTEATARDISRWIKARPAGTMCRLMRKQAEQAAEEISVGGAHDALNSRLYSVISLATEGHSGVSPALRKMRDAFYAEVTAPGRKGRRSVPEASAEFNRARDGAIRIMMASVKDGESALEEECACAGSSLDWGDKLGIAVDEVTIGGKTRAKFGKAKAPDKYTFDDSGNAEHMLDILDGSGYYIAGEKVWYFWDPALGAWQPDPHGNRALQAAQIVGKRCREMSDELMDKLKAQGSSLSLDLGGDVAQKINQLDKHAKISSDHKGLVNMVKIAAAQSRADRSAEDFDRQGHLLACPNGTIELLDGDVVFRPGAREDMVSLTTGTAYVPGARSAAWDAYLSRFVPAPEVQRYLQVVAGYTLFGKNPERKMFFMQGGTSTGKTTFVNAFNTALGQYAGTMNLSLFRDNQDEKPRPDLVRGLSKRLLSASEASAEWYLHGDQIKRLTGGDPVTARLLYSSTYVSRKPAFTPWVATNAMPHVKGNDKALGRRLVRIPFDIVIDEGAEDYKIPVALESREGREAVLAWAVRGWELYREDGRIEPPAAILEATKKMLGELSDLDVFLNEVCDIVPVIGGSGVLNGGVGVDCVPFADLFLRWEAWADDARIAEKDRFTKNKFGRELTGRGFEVDTRRIDGVATKVRTGLTLPGDGPKR